ncbi:hypothetical protein AVEN_262130-1 [Araneus ventricosus]|uniref:Uncharacterized protein n=1 Tax=Araneus ventricosus TaxID=182803 RepID=A0A4Y2E7V1_ARAVE|nr:hypothetical protein AVEN_262130-1 [Araneus ventricosus]
MGWIQSSGSTSIDLKRLYYHRSLHFHALNIITSHAYHLLPIDRKASCTISSSTSVDVPQRSPYSTDDILPTAEKDPWSGSFMLTKVPQSCGLISGEHGDCSSTFHRRDSIRTMTQCIVKEDHWSERKRVVSLSPECWTQRMSDEFAVVGSINILSWRYSALQCCDNQGCRAECEGQFLAFSYVSG